METTDTNSKIKAIELRSEKVRNIIGNIPPFIVRTGTSILFFIFCGIITGSMFFKYSPTYNLKTIITPLNDTVICKIQIPANLRNKINIGDSVLLSFDDIPNIASNEIMSYIDYISSDLTIELSGGYYLATLNTPFIFISEKNKIEIKETITTQTIVYCKKQTYFQFIKDNFFLIFKNLR